MPKSIKGHASRKPPEPSPSHSDIDAWAERQMPYYGLPQFGWIIELAAYDVSVNVVFFGGADFDDPPPRGTVDRTRYVKVTSPEDVQRSELHGWIAEAARTPGWR